MISRRKVMLGTAAALAAPQLMRVASAQDAPYIVGTLFPMAGPNAEYGEIFMAGATLGVDYVTKSKVLKRPIELRSVDSLSTPQGGAVGMSRLVNVDRADYVLLAFTGVCKAAAPIGGRAKTIMCNPGSVAPDLSGLSPYFWNMIPLVTKELDPLLTWMMSKSLKRVSAIYVDDPFGNGVMTALKPALAKAGGQMISTYPITPTEQVFTALAAKIRAENPDAVYFLSAGAQQVELVKQLRNNGITQQLVSAVGVNIPSILNLPEAKGLVFTDQATNWNSTDPLMKTFVENYRAKYNKDPMPYHLNFFNAIVLFGILASTLEKQGKPVNGDNLREQLLAQRKFALAGGTGEFDDVCDISLPVAVDEVTGDGKFKQIG